MMKLLQVLTAVFYFLSSTIVTSQELTTITTGDENLPMSVAWIIYSRVDPGTTKEIFRRDNPHLERYGWDDELPAFTEFFVPIGDRLEIAEISREDLTAVRFAEDRPILDFRYAGYDPEHGNPIMTIEEVRKRNPDLSDATDMTIIPAWTPIYYLQD